MYESGENYLETILILTLRKGNVRSIDVAREMNFTKPSVSRAMGILKKEGYIEMESHGDIKLTEMGRVAAERVYERHQLLTGFLVRVAGVTEELAEVDACKMEHILSQEVFEGIKAFMSKG